MQNYLLVDDDTGEKSYAALPVGEKLPKGAIKVEAQPSGEFEAHCEKTGTVLTDEAALADSKAGAQVIAAAHAVKIVEARLILVGISIDGVLAAEAKALGLDLAGLAAQVVEKAKPALKAEVERRKAKSKGSII